MFIAFRRDIFQSLWRAIVNFSHEVTKDHKSQVGKWLYNLYFFNNLLCLSWFWITAPLKSSLVFNRPIFPLLSTIIVLLEYQRRIFAEISERFFRTIKSTIQYRGELSSHSGSSFKYSIVSLWIPLAFTSDRECSALPTLPSTLLAPRTRISLIWSWSSSTFWSKKRSENSPLELIP